MDALVICGGRGTRLESEVEKPLVCVAGEPMLDRVVAACRASRAGPVHAVVSPHAPATRERAVGLGVRVVDAPGEGYVADLGTALDAVGRPALSVAADLPLLTPGHLDRTLAACEGPAVVGNGDGHEAEGTNARGTVGGEAGRSDGEPVPSVTVCVPAALKRRLGLSCETTTRADGRELAPAGVNVVGTADAPERRRVSWDARLAVNVNRPADRDVAEVLA